MKCVVYVKLHRVMVLFFESGHCKNLSGISGVCKSADVTEILFRMERRLIREGGGLIRYVWGERVDTPKLGE